MNKARNAAITLIILLILGAVGYSISKNKKNNNPNSTPTFIDEVPRNLTAEQRKIYEDRLAEAVNKLAETKDDQAKYDWTMQKGFQLYGLGRLSEAQDAFEEAAKIKPNSVGAYVSIFQVQVDRGNNEGALASIKKAIDLNMLNADAWKKLIQLRLDRFNASNDEINALYKEAETKTSSNIDILTSYAAWLELAGNLQGSIDYWKKAIEIKPDNKKIYQAEIDRLKKLIK